ncbi:hypothetical protein HY612_04745, partial [Candidatus Roizmanbacteria bacterium]|nr:hypothetical protein [Candidatus Roizmanbacteria bacterium]
MIEMTVETVAPTPSEAAPKQEYTKEQVLKAFSDGLAVYEKIIGPLKEKQAKYEVDPSKNPPLDDEEKRKLADFNICIDGDKNATGDGKQIGVESSFNGKSFMSREGIPVEGMIKTLKEEIKRKEDAMNNLEQGVQLKIIHEILDLKRTLKTIEDNSVSYAEARERDGFKDPDFFEARKKAEAFFRFEDPLRQSGNDGEDYKQAGEALERRRELVVPAEAVKTEPPEELPGEKLPQPTRQEPPPPPELSEQDWQRIMTEGLSRPDVTLPSARPPQAAERPPEEQLSPPSRSESPEDIDSSHLESRFVAERFYQDNIDSPEAKVSELEEARKNKKEGKLY